MRDIASIVGLKVISSSEGRDVGTVSQVIVDLASGKVLGLIVGKGATEKAIEAKDVAVIGTDAVMVQTHKLARHLSEVPALLEARRDPAAGPKPVITDTGKRLGVLGTVYVDPATATVSRYEVSCGAWRDITEGVLSLPPLSGTVDGPDSIIVPEQALSDSQGAPGGLRAQIAKLAEVARTQAQQAAESLEGSTQSVKRTVAATAQKRGADDKSQTVAPQTETQQSPQGAQSQPAADQHGASAEPVEGRNTAEQAQNATECSDTEKEK